ncbi:hypothetical protein RHMOL_Rhmol04G0225200 [Rhododendron molle]|uniref:Uncharacterized protein n=1 Tax=Rhododendron molle TaxID=49168 RepID=A0ACC0P4B5_RHOML|nr:hypothetical protein RHMOL_Rhmol04G0225200 [Rhododendron molle]
MGFGSNGECKKEDDEEWLGWEGEELGLQDLGNAQNANDDDDDDDDDEEEEIEREGGQCVTDSGNGRDNHTDSDSDFICSGLKDSSSSDGDDIEYVQNEGVDGNKGGCLPVRNFQEDLGKGVVITEVEESDNSDENVSVVISSDDDNLKKKKGKKKMMKCPEFNAERDTENPKLVEGMLFPNVKVFRAFLKEFHLRNGCQYKYHKNESRRVTVKCKDEEGEPPCQWRLHASRVGDTTTYQIIRLRGEHTCPRVYHNQWASAEWLAKKYLNEINDDPDWKAVVEFELKDSWTWFLELLTDVIGKPEDKGWIFISDRQKGLTESMDLLFPGVEHSPRAKTNRMVNNLSESFNNAIKNVRDEPILTMMEGLRRYVMQRHVCAAMTKDRRKPKDFIFPYCLTETFRNSYAYLINPIPDKSMWVHIEYDDIMPPPYRRKSGRPKKARRKGAEESLAV